MLADVALPIPVETTFTYRVPEEWQSEIEAGHRVVVSFGPRTLTGVVVSVRETQDAQPDAPKYKPIDDIPDDQPALTPELLKLTRWVADYYVCGWGEAIRAALPPGIEITSESTVERTDRPAKESDATGDMAEVLQYLQGRGPVSVATVRRRFPSASTARLRRLERDDFLRMSTRIKAPRASVKMAKFLSLGPAIEHLAAAREAIADLRGHRQKAVLAYLVEELEAGEPEAPYADVVEETKASAATVKSLAQKGLIRLELKEDARSGFADVEVSERSVAPQLHAEQQSALKEIEGAVSSGGYAAFLLHGVTGSGKTEVYLAALDRALREGRSGVILVPEIALTPQMVARFRARFGDEISVLHSRMSVGERFDAWRAVREGRHRIVIGPRSAIFAPVANLGLIVVDEEHESSYKQYDPSPRYHARDAAVMRAHMEGATVVLGSATPSLESYVNATHDKYMLLAMPNRVPVRDGNAAVLPKVEIVDLTVERKKHQLEGTLSLRLREAIAGRISKGEQVILLQNRRGFAPILECESCGYSPTCPDCSVTYTYHKFGGRLRCHYCGRTQRVPVHCPSCGALDMRQLGAGTQRVEEELDDVFPDANVLRMDLDTTGRKHSHHRILTEFGEGKADILLGTQMVAKGLDFGNVTLVGVVNADTELLLPDFRAEERTFQLLTQVAGRAGRADRPGLVLLQTRNAGNLALGYAMRHDFEGFADYALRGRRELGYPPFGQMVVVEFSGFDEEAARSVGIEWTDLFRSRGNDARILGPHPAFIRRVKRRYRFQTVIRVLHRQRAPMMQDRLRAATAAYGTPPGDCRIAIDVDAVGLR